VFQVFSYGRLLHDLPLPPPFDSISTYSNRFIFVEFMAYMLGVVAFVFRLKEGHYKYQFGLFGWCHVTLLLVVLQTVFTVYNLFEGIFWLVICYEFVVQGQSKLKGVFFSSSPPGSSSQRC